MRFLLKANVHRNFRFLTQKRFFSNINESKQEELQEVKKSLKNGLIYQSTFADGFRKDRIYMASFATLFSCIYTHLQNMETLSIILGSAFLVNLGIIRVAKNLQNKMLNEIRLSSDKNMLICNTKNESDIRIELDQFEIVAGQNFKEGIFYPIKVGGKIKYSIFISEKSSTVPEFDALNAIIENNHESLKQFNVIDMENN